MEITALLLLVLGLVLGATAGHLVAARGRSTSAAALEAVRVERDAARAQADEYRRERDAALLRAQAAEGAQHAATATLEAERRSAAEQLETERRAATARLEELESRFQLLTQKVLEDNRESFLNLAEERFRRTATEQAAELAKREKAIETLVKPLSDSLAQVQDQVRKVEVARAEAYAQLVEQVQSMRTTSEQLRTETGQLVTALRRPQVRGQWGEEVLRRTVEASGMVKHVHFTEQVSVTDEEGAALRPDLVVHLSGGKNVVVDSKVPFSAFLEATEAVDDAVRAERLKAHARHVRTHVDQLAAKEYWARLEPTPEFVVLFVPADSFLNAALEQEPTLLEHAFERNVVIATPSTLVALLRTIGYAWRQEALARNAQEVLRLGKDLHGRIATMGSHVAGLGRALDRSVKAFNDTVGSLETRVLVPARKLADLGLSDKDIDPIAPIESVTRALQREELVASANDDLVALPDADPSPRTAGPSKAQAVATEPRAGEDGPDGDANDEGRALG